MNWFGGDLEIRLLNGNTLRIGPVRFDEASIKAVLDERVRPGSVKTLMYHPYPTTVEIPEGHRA